MISAYTGLPGSGKSYETVAFVIIPALVKGRRIVTNIHGIDNDAIRAYVADTEKVAIEKVGSIVCVEDDDVKKEGFFPIKDPDSTAIPARIVCIDSIVKSGDMVILDEANRFYPTDSLRTIPKSHINFFREHRHFTDPDSGFACDIVLITQDISDLHRVFKVVVEFTYVCFKFKALGLPKKYRCDIYNGYKINNKTKVTGHIRNYNKAIFPLYKSYIGEIAKEDNVDSRLNFWKSPIFVRTAFYIILFLFGGGYITYRFFFNSPFVNEAKAKAEANNKGQTNNGVSSSGNSKQSAAANSKESAPEFQSRIIGIVTTLDDTWYMIYDEGRLRYVRGDSTDSTFRSEITHKDKHLTFTGLVPLEPKK